MDKLKDKSDLNISAAEFMLEKNMYCSVCHPAYYSCLQLMKYYIKNKLDIDYERQATDTSSTYHGDSHRYIITIIRQKLKESINKEVARVFDSQIKDLKNWRITSDYSHEDVNRDQCIDAIRIAKEIRKTITNNIKKQ
ncbi:HEPN domain-containing protein [Bacteroides fragilis]|uniref:HEPN domain-containing protein n=1 Tax=Bacteroides fragilis TaxID=817 RepID=UPI0015F6495F|nr:HEPN domain-containing protein [Bacteroides fragilis]MBA5649998.1 HEPN domain-containing protein [Bacteroides fragilis]